MIGIRPVSRSTVVSQVATQVRRPGRPARRWLRGPAPGAACRRPGTSRPWRRSTPPAWPRSRRRARAGRSGRRRGRCPTACAPAQFVASWVSVYVVRLGGLHERELHARGLDLGPVDRPLPVRDVDAVGVRQGRGGHRGERGHEHDEQAGRTTDGGDRSTHGVPPSLPGAAAATPISLQVVQVSPRSRTERGGAVMKTPRSVEVSPLWGSPDSRLRPRHHGRVPRGNVTDRAMFGPELMYDDNVGRTTWGPGDLTGLAVRGTGPCTGCPGCKSRPPGPPPRRCPARLRQRARPGRVVGARRVVGEVEVEHERPPRPRRGRRP